MAEEKLIPEWIPIEILNSGCATLADRQNGKTNLIKVVLAEMFELPNIQIKIFDTAQVWRHSFLSSFIFQEIGDGTRQVIHNNENIIYDIEYTDSERIMQFMGNEVFIDYKSQRAKKKACDGKLNDWILYCLEEAHNSLGSYSLNRQSGRFWLKAISEGANFNLGFILIGQRPADISTKAIERMQTYWIGKTTGDNNTRKLKGIVGAKAGVDQLGRPIHEKAKEFERGEFLFWNGRTAQIFNCPKFEELYPNQKPTQIKPPKKRWIKLW